MIFDVADLRHIRYRIQFTLLGNKRIIKHAAIYSRTWSGFT